MAMELLFEQVGEFRGNFPDIPLPSDIDREALGEDAFFVTLPVGRVNAKSRGSGRVYTESAVRSLVEQINKKRPEGRWGHLSVSELATRYDPPAIRWLAAELIDGVAWAKGLPLTEQAIDHFRKARATNARVGTSVFGPPPVVEGNRVIDLELYSIDIADPARVGIPETAAQPSLTSEMETRMSDINEQMLAEMRSERDAARQEVGTLKAANAQLETKVADLEGKLTVFEQAQAVLSEMADACVTMGLNLNAGSDLATVIREMIGKLQAQQAAELIGKIESAVAEMVTLEALRPLVSEMLIGGEGDARRPLVKDLDEAKAKITAYLERDSVKKLAQGLVSEQAGPNALAGATPKDTGDWRSRYIDNADKLAQERGIR